MGHMAHLAFNRLNGSGPLDRFTCLNHRGPRGVCESAPDMRAKVRIALAMLVAGALAACGSESSQDRAERGTRAVEICGGHDGVAAFDDDSVICGDQTATDGRGSRAVAACRDHDGVSAFDDDLVICGDGTFHRVEGG